MDLEKELLEMVLINARNALEAKKIDIISEETLVKAVPVIIETVERVKTKGITGVEKKHVALKVLMLIVNESMILDDEKKGLLKSLIEGGTLEVTIDLIVDASKGKFEFNRKTRNKVYLCLAACFSRLGRKKNATDDDGDDREKSERVVKLEPLGDTNEEKQDCEHECCDSEGQHCKHECCGAGDSEGQHCKHECCDSEGQDCKHECCDSEGQDCKHECCGADDSERQKEECNTDTTYYPETRMTISTI